jgi:ubiquitin-conjugating enzyme E2 N
LELQHWRERETNTGQFNILISKELMSTAHRQRRIRKEFENFARGLIAGVKIVERSNVGDLLIEMEGPKESPFEGNNYLILCCYPEEYPHEPPIVKFLTSIFHPSISVEGEVCLSILQDEWLPSLTIESIIVGILDLLLKPDDEGTFNIEATTIFAEDYERFEHLNSKVAKAA